MQTIGHLLTSPPRPSRRQVVKIAMVGDLGGDLPLEGDVEGTYAVGGVDVRELLGISGSGLVDC